MADNPKLEIDVVLSDGTVTKAFSNIEKQGIEAADKVGNSFTKAFSGLTSGQGFGGIALGITALNQGLEVTQKILGAIGTAAQTAFNQILIGEEIEKVNKQFDLLARNAGVNVGALRDGLNEATGGVIGFEEVLKSAGQALVRLGSNGDRLPEIFEVARKATALFGGDAIQQFEGITRAIQTGQSRSLAQIGIIVDLNKAQTEYAKSVGKTSEQLSQQEQLQVNLNTVLEAAKVQYAAVSLEVDSVGVSYQRLTESVNGFFDGFAIGIKTVFAPVAQVLIDAANSALTAVNSLFSFQGADRNTQRLGELRAEIAKLQEELNKPNQSAANIELLTTRLGQAQAAYFALNQQNNLNGPIEAQNKLNITIDVGTQSINNQTAAIDRLKKAHTDKTKSVVKELTEEEKQIKSLNDTIEQGAENLITGVLAQLGRSIGNGGKAFENFGATVLGILGSVAIQIGSFIIGTAIAFSALRSSILGAPFIAIAAGAALIALGGILQGISSRLGGNQTGGTVTATSGAGIGGPALVTEDTTQELQNFRPDEARTGVTVNIVGDVFDSDQTGLRIVEILNSAFDKQGLEIRQGAIV